MAIGAQESPFWVLCLFLFHRPSQTSGGHVNVNVSDTSEKGLTVCSSAPLSPRRGGLAAMFPNKMATRVASEKRVGPKTLERASYSQSFPKCLQDEMKGRLEVCWQKLVFSTLLVWHAN